RPAVVLEHATVCAQSGLRAGPRCGAVVGERFAPGTVPAHVCDAHADDGALLVSPRYAEWIARARPADVRVRAEAAAEGVGAPVVVHPSPGSRVLVGPRRGETRIPLRATIGGRPVDDATWEIDGAPWHEPTWPLQRGEHRFVA